eukprot:SAG11_NODE_382_length_9923_cov_29.276771_2_plen_83_part_00
MVEKVPIVTIKLVLNSSAALLVKRISNRSPLRELVTRILWPAIYRRLSRLTVTRMSMKAEAPTSPPLYRYVHRPAHPSQREN